jgi:hypothetical protein
MSDFSKSKFNRRGVLKSSMAVLGGGLLSRYSLEKAAAEQEPAVKNVNLNSSPSTLKITDMRYAQHRYDECEGWPIQGCQRRRFGRSPAGVLKQGQDELEEIKGQHTYPQGPGQA